VKGDPKVIAVLNQVLKAELTAINQYFLHAEMCENWGYERLAKHTREESIEEMRHAEKLMEHILFLDGTPNLSDYFKINIGPNVKAQLQNDLNVEYDAVKRLNAGIETCVKAGDNGSRDLLEGILTDEEEHIDWLEGQLHAISRLADCDRSPAAFAPSAAAPSCPGFGIAIGPLRSGGYDDVHPQSECCESSSCKSTA
jgi:bacterioferritin